MADFEVEHLLKRAADGEEVVVVVQYNPAGESVSTSTPPR